MNSCSNGTRVFRIRNQIITFSPLNAMDSTERMGTYMGPSSMGAGSDKADGLDENCVGHVPQGGWSLVPPARSRHTFISALGEAGVPESTLKAIAGWMSAKMLERYSHTRDQAKREAVEKLPRRRPNPYPA